MLREPLTREHVKPRLLGHFGTTPGLNLVYAHLNRVIRERDLDVVFIAGPGHGGPGMVANAYLEGTYSEVYSDISRDEAGMRRLFKQFSFPGGIPSHHAPETPGSMHEGGELGYALSHAYGAIFDNPALVVACVVGDGEAETGPLATSWHSTRFVNPARDGAVLPILNLNGYKIANPTVLSRISHEELEALFVGYGYKPIFVEGSDPALLRLVQEEPSDAVAWFAVAALRLIEDKRVNEALRKTDLTDARVQVVALAARAFLPVDHDKGIELFRRAIEDDADDDGSDDAHLDFGYRVLISDALDAGDLKEARQNGVGFFGRTQVRQHDV